MDGRLNLADAFTNYERSSRMFEHLARTLQGVDPTIALLVLEGLYRIESHDLQKRQFMSSGYLDEKLKNFLRQWRCEAPLIDPYAKKCVPGILNCLTVFKALDVPLFTGNFGQKKTLNDYGEGTEGVIIDKNTSICSMPDGGSKFGTGFGLNRMKGRWYKLCSPRDNMNAAHDNVTTKDDNDIKDDDNDTTSNETNKNKNPKGGAKTAKAMTTTLGKLGISCLRQGEIVYHYHDSSHVNTNNNNNKSSSRSQNNNRKNNTAYVILYAEDTTSNEDCFQDLKQPTKTALRSVHYLDCDAEVVIFVPDRNRKIMKCKDCSPFWSHRNEVKVSKQNRLIQNDDVSKNCVEMDAHKMDLIWAFTAPEGCTFFYAELTKALAEMDGTLGLLALEGLYRLDKAVGQLNDSDIKQLKCNESLVGGLKKLLRKWVCDFPSGPVPAIWWRLRNSLILYKTLQVPLFVDTLFKAEIRGLGNFSPDQMEDIDIDGETPIFHVTHRTHARYISNQNKFKGSNKKNAVKGTWFGLGDQPNSIYGSKCFKTKLYLLGVTGLYQGEVVYYLAERNVILYATDEIGADFKGLKKPTQAFVEREAKGSSRPFVNVSIFIPSRLLPSAKTFWNVVTKENDVCHKPLCMKIRRGEREFCDELVGPIPDPRQFAQPPHYFPQPPCNYPYYPQPPRPNFPWQYRPPFRQPYSYSPCFGDPPLPRTIGQHPALFPFSNTNRFERNQNQDFQNWFYFWSKLMNQQRY